MKFAVLPYKIYEVRGQKVMLDFDLAALYEVETRILNQAIKRNIASFPIDFMFKLSKKEWQNMSSQIVMTSSVKRPKTALPYAFTEHGVTMLASVLKSPKARRMNIAIVRAFIELRKAVIEHREILQQLDEFRERLGMHDAQLNQIYKAIESLLHHKTSQEQWKENRRRIGFKET